MLVLLPRLINPLITGGYGCVPGQRNCIRSQNLLFLSVYSSACLAKTLLVSARFIRNHSIHRAGFSWSMRNYSCFLPLIYFVLFAGHCMQLQSLGVGSGMCIFSKSGYVRSTPYSHEQSDLNKKSSTFTS